MPFLFFILICLFFCYSFNAVILVECVGCGSVQLGTCPRAPFRHVPSFRHGGTCPSSGSVWPVTLPSFHSCKDMFPYFLCIIYVHMYMCLYCCVVKCSLVCFSFRCPTYPHCLSPSDVGPVRWTTGRCPCSQRCPASLGSTLASESSIVMNISTGMLCNVMSCCVCCVLCVT